jgi:hypothetical protein
MTNPLTQFSTKKENENPLMQFSSVSPEPEEENPLMQFSSQDVPIPEAPRITPGLGGKLNYPTEKDPVPKAVPEQKNPLDAYKSQTWSQRIRTAAALGDPTKRGEEGKQQYANMMDEMIAEIDDPKRKELIQTIKANILSSWEQDTVPLEKAVVRMKSLFAPTIGAAYEIATGKPWMTEDEAILADKHKADSVVAGVAGTVGLYTALGMAGVPISVSFPGVKMFEETGAVRSRHKNLNIVQKTGRVAVSGAMGSLMAATFGAAAKIVPGEYVLPFREGVKQSKFFETMIPASLKTLKYGAGRGGLGLEAMAGRIVSRGLGAGTVAGLEYMTKQLVSGEPINFDDMGRQVAHTALFVTALGALTEIPGYASVVNLEGKRLLADHPKLAQKYNVKNPTKPTLAESSKIIQGELDINPSNLSAAYQANAQKAARDAYLKDLSAKAGSHASMKTKDWPMWKKVFKFVKKKEFVDILKDIDSQKTVVKRTEVVDRFLNQKSVEIRQAVDSTKNPSEWAIYKGEKDVFYMPIKKASAQEIGEARGQLAFLSRFRDYIIKGASPVDLLRNEAVGRHITNAIRAEEALRKAELRDGYYLAKDPVGKIYAKAKTQEGLRKAVELYYDNVPLFEKFTIDPNIIKTYPDRIADTDYGDVVPTEGSQETVESTLALPAEGEKGSVEVNQTVKPLNVSYKSVDHEEAVHSLAATAVEQLDIRYGLKTKKDNLLTFDGVPPEVRTDIKNFIVSEQISEDNIEILKDFILSELRKPRIYEYKGAPDSPNTQVWIGERLFHGLDPLVTIEQLRQELDKPDFAFSSPLEFTAYGPHSKDLLMTLYDESLKNQLKSQSETINLIEEGIDVFEEAAELDSAPSEDLTSKAKNFTDPDSFIDNAMKMYGFRKTEDPNIVEVIRTKDGHVVHLIDPKNVKEWERLMRNDLYSVWEEAMNRDNTFQPPRLETQQGMRAKRWVDKYLTELGISEENQMRVAVVDKFEVPDNKVFEHISLDKYRTKVPELDGAKDIAKANDFLFDGEKDLRKIIWYRGQKKERIHHQTFGDKGVLPLTSSDETALDYYRGYSIQDEDQWNEYYDSGQHDEDLKNIEEYFVDVKRPLVIDDVGLQVLGNIDQSSVPERDRVGTSPSYNWWEFTRPEYRKTWENILIPALKKQGYDAIVYQDDVNSGKSLAVFDRKQLEKKTEKTEIPTVQSYYDPAQDRVFIVAENIGSEEQARSAVIHAVTYRGVIGVAKDLDGVEALDEILDSASEHLLRAMPDLIRESGFDNVDDFLNAYGFDPETREGRTRLLIDLSSRWAGKFADKPKESWWNGFVDALVQWIKKLFGVKMKHDEVDKLIAGFTTFGFVKEASTVRLDEITQSLESLPGEASEVQWSEGGKVLTQEELMLGNIIDNLEDWFSSLTAQPFKESLAPYFKNLNVITIYEELVKEAIDEAAETEEQGEEANVELPSLGRDSNSGNFYLKRQHKIVESESGGFVLGLKTQTNILKENKSFAKHIYDLYHQEFHPAVRLANQALAKDDSRLFGIALYQMKSALTKKQRLLATLYGDEGFHTLKRGLMDWTKPTAAEIEADIANLQGLIDKITAQAEAISTIYLEEIVSQVSLLKDKKLKFQLEETIKVLGPGTTAEQLRGVVRAIKDYITLGRFGFEEKATKHQSDILRKIELEETAGPLFGQIVFNMTAENNNNENDPRNELDSRLRLQPSQIERLPNGDKVDGQSLSSVIGGAKSNPPPSPNAPPQPDANAPMPALPKPWTVDEKRIGFKLKTKIAVARTPFLSNMFMGLEGAPPAKETQAQVLDRIMRQKGEKYIKDRLLPLKAKESVIDHVKMFSLEANDFAEYSKLQRGIVKQVIIDSLATYVESKHGHWSGQNKRKYIDLMDKIFSHAVGENKINYVYHDGKKMPQISLTSIGFEGPWEKDTRLEREQNITEAEANVSEWRFLYNELRSLFPDMPEITNAQDAAMKARRPRQFFTNLLPDDVKDILYFSVESFQDPVFFSMIDAGIMDRSAIVANRERGWFPAIADRVKRKKRIRPSGIQDGRILEKTYRTFAEFKMASQFEGKGFGLVVEENYSDSLGRYVEESLNKIKTNTTINLLRGIPNTKAHDIGYVTYTPEVNRMLKAKGKKDDAAAAKKWLEDNDYYQMADASGLRGYYGGGWQEPWVHESIASVLRLYFVVQREQTIPIARIMMQVFGAVKRSIMWLAQKMVYQVQSSPMLWLPWKYKWDLFIKDLITAKPLWGGMIDFAKKRNNPLHEMQDEMFDLEKYMSYIQHGAKWLLPGWVAKSTYDSPDARKHPQMMNSWEFFWRFLGGKAGMDRYAFSSMIPRIMYRYVETIENMLLDGKIKVTPLDFIKLNLGPSLPVGKLTQEQARKMAVYLAGTTAGMINDNAYSWEKNVLQLALFARNFNVSFLRQLSGALLYGTAAVPLGAAVGLATAGPAGVMPGVAGGMAATALAKKYAKKRRLIAGGDKGKHPLSPFNLLLHGEVPQDQLDIVGKFMQTHLTMVIMMGYFKFSMAQLGLSYLGDWLAALDETRFGDLKTKDEADRWMFNNVKLVQIPYTDKKGKRQVATRIANPQNAFRVRTPFKDNRGQNLYLDFIMFREMVNLFNLVTNPGKFLMSKVAVPVKLAIDFASEETVIGSTLVGMNALETWEMKVAHVMNTILPDELKHNDPDLPYSWKALAMWGMRATTAATVGSSREELELAENRIHDEFIRLARDLVKEEMKAIPKGQAGREKLLNELRQKVLDKKMTEDQAENEYLKALVGEKRYYDFMRLKSKEMELYRRGFK